jgi:hypothetical protein
MSEKNGIKEFLQLVGWLTAAFVAVYYLPELYSRLLFLLLLLVVWRSKRDYFWLAFFLILLDQPGGFFSGGERTDTKRLPIYSLMAGFSFTITQLYLILLVIKSITKNRFKKPSIYFRNNLEILGWYVLVLLVVSGLIGFSFTSMRETYRTIINLTLFFSMFYILPNHKSLFHFLRLLFPFVFLAVLAQIYGLTFHQQPVELFKPGAGSHLYALDNMEGWDRPIELVFTLFICFTGSLFLLGQEERPFSTWYLILVNTTSFFSIFLSGTRTWVVGFLFAYLLFLIFNKSKLPTYLFRSLIGLGLAAFVLHFIPVVNHHIDNIWLRISTVAALAEGDLSMGGTAVRFQEHAPSVWEGYLQSTIVCGAGFSDLFYEYDNIHVGYHNLLFNTGVVGVLLYLFFIVKLLRKPFEIENERHAKINKIAILPIIILLVINVGVQTIGYTVIHTPFYIIQAYALSLVVIAYNYPKDTTWTGMEEKQVRHEGKAAAFKRV